MTTQNTRQSLCLLCGKRRSSRTQHIQDVQVCSRKTCAKTQRLIERVLRDSSSPVIRVHHYYHAIYANNDISNCLHYSCDLHAEVPNIEALAELPENYVRPRSKVRRY